MSEDEVVAAMVAALRGVDPDDEVAVFRRLLERGFADRAIERGMDPAMEAARAERDAAYARLGI